MVHVSVGSCIALVALFAWLSGVAIARHPKERLNRIFAVLCLLMAFMSLAQTMGRVAPDVSGARLWFSAGRAVWPFCVALIFLFGLAYTRARNAPVRWAPIMVLAAATLALSILSATAQDPRSAAGGVPWSLQSPLSKDSITNFLSALWGASSSVTTLCLLLRYRRGLRDRTARRQATVVTVGFSLPPLTALLTQAVLPLLGFPVPGLSAAAGLWLALCVGYAMLRYELFVADPAQAADRILSVMREAVLLLDAEGAVAYANRSARQLWEGSGHGPVGMSVAEVLGPGFAEAGGMERLLGDGGEAVLEITSRSTDGTAISLLVSGAFLRSSTPEHAQGAVLVAADISVQKRLEGTLQSSRQMLRNLVDNGQANIILLDPRGVIQVCNEPFARYFGQTSSSVVGRNLFSLIPDADVKDMERRLAQVVSSGTSMHYDDFGGGRHWEHRLTPVSDHEGKVTCVTVFTLDVTERVEAERARERLIGELSEALSRVKTLTGLIPICSHCKRIRNDKGYWQQVEQYVAEHTDADFSHGLCNDCLRELYPEIAAEALEDEANPAAGARE